MKNRRLVAAVGMLGAALVLTACGSGSEEAAPANDSAATEEVVVEEEPTASDTPAESGGQMQLAYTATLTGEFAVFGLDMLDGVNLAIEQINASGGINGATVSLETADDQGKPNNGPVVAQKFCDSDAAAVLGYSFSSVALAAVPIYDQCGLSVVASAVTSPELSGASPYFFRDVPTDAFQGAEAGVYAVEKFGAKKIAVMFQQDDYGIGVQESFSKAAEAAGAEITSAQGYQLGTRDFRSLLENANREGAELIFIGGFYAEAAKIVQQAREMGMDQQFMGTDGALSPDLISLADGATEGMVIYTVFTITNPRPEVQDFVAAFQAKYGKEPSSWAALAYDAVFAVKAGAEAGGGTSREQVAGGLPKIGIDGVTGPLEFNAEGDRVAELVFLEVKGDSFVPVGG
jgi:branched-chain amino acid transport system substrate-binding protein